MDRRNPMQEAEGKGKGSDTSVVLEDLARSSVRYIVHFVIDN
jgi:hypothetical protein